MARETFLTIDYLTQKSDRLKQRAVIHGRSLESELDSILTSVFEQKTAENSLKDLLLAMPDIGILADFNCVRDNAREVLL